MRSTDRDTSVKWSTYITNYSLKESILFNYLILQVPKYGRQVERIQSPVLAIDCRLTLLTLLDIYMHTTQIDIILIFMDCLM